MEIDEDPIETFDNLNLEGILDEALSLGQEETQPQDRAASTLHGGDPLESESGETALSGVLDEALGFPGSSPESAQPLEDSEVEVPVHFEEEERSGLDDEELQFFGEQLESLPASEPPVGTEPAPPLAPSIPPSQRGGNLRSPTLALSKTSPPSSPTHPVKVQLDVPVKDFLSGSISVPVQVFVDPDVDETELQLILNIRISRKTSS